MPEAAIGVVIPAYNAIRFLGEAIESVRVQTVSTWECAIVDDGSTDETPRLLASYDDPRIRFVRQPNCGEREARMQGLRLTGAPKVVFLDADDRLLPDALIRYLRFLDDHPSVGVAYGERALIREDGTAFSSWSRAILNKHPKGDVLKSVLKRPFLSTPSQACFRRKAVPPPEWLEGQGKLGDWLLFAGAALRNRFAYLGVSPLVEYRIRRLSMLRSFAADPGEKVGIQEFEEILNRLFSLPGLDERFGPAKLSSLRRTAEASCFAIKGQEFLRRREYRIARKYFQVALRLGSGDLRDFLCWLATFSPSLLRLVEPLYGVVENDE